METQLVPQSRKGLELQEVDLTLSPAEPTAEDDSQITIVDSPFPVFPVLLEPTGLGERLKVSPEALPSTFMVQAWNSYSGRCVCGTTYANNCAHYLTNAFALAGATFPAGTAKCPQGRMIRAKEVLSWFRSLATGFESDHNSITEGYWFVYQESGGQGHVCMHREATDSYLWRGTGDYPSWPVQWHYFF
jgi:hypothetical protein